MRSWRNARPSGKGVSSNFDYIKLVERYALTLSPSKGEAAEPPYFDKLSMRALL